MKRFILFAIALVSLNASSQSLLDLYRKGTVKLIPEANYGQGNQWDSIFDSYNDYPDEKRSASDRMSIVMMPDGSIVVNHPKRDYFSRFDPNGKFVKNFSIVDKSGKPMKNRLDIQGVINQNFYTKADNAGNIRCVDFDGNYLKTLRLNYMLYDMIPMKDNKLAVVGFAVWKNKSSRRFVAIVDYNTNEEKIIWDAFDDEKSAPRMIVRDEGWSPSPSDYERMKVPPFGYSYYYNQIIAKTPIIQFTHDLLVVALPSLGEIRMYDINGKLQKTQQVDWPANLISVDEQKDLLRNVIEAYKKTPLTDKVSKNEAEKAREEVLVDLNASLEKIKIPIELPSFSNVLKDSDGNLLFFEFPKEKGGNRFNVWIFRDGGKFECQCSFECDDYDLAITPAKMIFHEGYIYALQKPKNAQDIPLRLIKFKLSN